MLGVVKKYSYKQPDGRWYRLVPSHFPTVNVFEDCYDSAEELEVAFEIEALTNDRLRQEAGNNEPIAAIVTRSTQDKRTSF